MKGRGERRGEKKKDGRGRERARGSKNRGRKKEGGRKAGRGREGKGEERERERNRRRVFRGVNRRGYGLPSKQPIGRTVGLLRQIKSNR